MIMSGIGLSEVGTSVAVLSKPLAVAAADDLLASLLGEGRPSLDALHEPVATPSFLAAAAAHGVDCLVRHELKRGGLWSRVPSALAAALDERARHESVLEALRRREMARVLGAFVTAGIDVLVLKGGALAYTHYAEAYLRPRADTDLLVRKQDIDQAVTALGTLGYTRVNSVNNDAVFTQAPFEHVAHSVRHAIDLHWAISNRPLFADVLHFDELLRSAVPVPGLGEGVLTLGPVHALLLACIHRTAHHDDSDLLIWLYDMKLLANSLSSKEWDDFLELAAQKRIMAVCHASLALAAARVGCNPEALDRIKRLAPPAGGSTEPSAAYLGVVGSGLQGMRLDLQATRGAAAKLRWVAGHVFPDAQYMRTSYGATNGLSLAGAYVRRAVLGLWRVARRTRIN